MPDGIFRCFVWGFFFFAIVREPIVLNNDKSSAKMRENRFTRYSYSYECKCDCKTLNLALRQNDDGFFLRYVPAS